MSDREAAELRGPVPGAFVATELISFDAEIVRPASLAPLPAGWPAEPTADGSPMSAAAALEAPVLAVDVPGDADVAEMATRTVDGLVARLDAQTAADGEAWELYRAAGGGWVVAVGLGSSVHVDRAADDLSRGFTRPSLAGVLVEACGSRRMPTVLAPPTLLEPGRFEVVKDGGWWYARDRVSRDRVEFKYRTRREAEGALARIVARQVEALAAWEARWGPVIAAGVEGADWRWAP